jgi:hypothetical protein
METSNFFKSGRLPNAVSIARSSPSFFTGEKDASLAPTWSLFKKGRYSKAEYVREVLKNRDPKEVYALHKNHILLCWEAPGNSCHRRYLAEWLQEELGVSIPERDYVPQPTLFDDLPSDAQRRPRARKPSSPRIAGSSKSGHRRLSR